MTVMQTTALKINSIPKLQWVIISVISIDQLCQVSILLVEQCRDTWHGAGDVSVCVCVCVQMKFNGDFFPHGDIKKTNI